METEPQIPLTYYVVREDVCAAQKAGGYVRMGETLHVPVLAAICRRLLGDPYKLQTQQVWVTLSHPASPTEFCSRAYDGEPNGTIRGPTEATVPPRDMT